eukprot:1127308-Prymnesium_polylepis.1
MYKIVEQEVAGLSYEHVRAGKPLSAEQADALKIAIKQLEAQGAVAICGTLPGLEPWLLGSLPLNPTTGVWIPVRQAIAA